MNRLRKLTGVFNKNNVASAVKPAVTATQTQATVEPIENQVEDQTKKGKKHYVTNGPCLYISTLMNQKGSMTTKQMWFEYSRDEAAVAENKIRSLTYLKTKIVPAMENSGKLEKLGFSNVKKRFLGYRLNPKRAFKNVDPDIVESIEPKVELVAPPPLEKRVRREKVSPMLGRLRTATKSRRRRF